MKEGMMRCVNPECTCGLLDLPGGSVWLMQLEVPRDQQTESEEHGFSACALPTKYFWLCADCSRRFVLLHWTPAGVVLAKNQPNTHNGAAKRTGDADTSSLFTVHASARVEEEFLDRG
jgi:hypothetical protein